MFFFSSSRSDIPVVVDSTPKLVRKHFGPTPSTMTLLDVDSTSKRRACCLALYLKHASKHPSTEVAPVPRKIPRIDLGCSVNMPPPNTVVNSENRYVDCV